MASISVPTGEALTATLATQREIIASQQRELNRWRIEVDKLQKQISARETMLEGTIIKLTETADEITEIVLNVPNPDPALLSVKAKVSEFLESFVKSMDEMEVDLQAAK